MTAPKNQTVASIHWTNWIGTICGISDGTSITVGLLQSVQFDTANGIYWIFFTPPATPLRHAGTDLILVATQAQASQLLYGVPLGS